MRAAWLLCALSGCAAAPTPDARATLRAWVDATTRDDPHAAYGLLSAELRRTLSEATFTRRFHEQSEERSAAAEALGRPGLAPVVAARVRFGRRQIQAVREPDRWRLRGPRSTEVGASTPEEALTRFVNALEARDLVALLQLLGDPLRGAVEREINDRLSKLKSALGKPIAIEGERATVRYDDTYHIDLIQENGIWRVYDLN